MQKNDIFVPINTINCMKNKFTIIVPVYNEEENLERVETELSNYLKVAAVPSSVLFVNDGSQDTSQAIIEEICKRNGDFEFILFKENR